MDVLANRHTKPLALRGLFLYDGLRPVWSRGHVWLWRWRGMRPPPPHRVKEETVKRYAMRFALDTLIETGTYLGDMISGTRETFKRILSIELDRALYERAQRRFSDLPHVTLFLGDSASILPRLVDACDRRCLFWLDAHYMGGLSAKGPIDTPIVQELRPILDHHIADHVVLIDDARCFTGQNGYPATADLREFILSKRPEWAFEVENDIIRCHVGPDYATEG